jgi:hypothetical protein
MAGRKRNVWTWDVGGDKEGVAWCACHLNPASQIKRVGKEKRV